MANARLTWRNAEDKLSISLEVTNIFDKYYVLDQFDAVAGLHPHGGQPDRPAARMGGDDALQLLEIQQSE